MHYKLSNCVHGEKKLKSGTKNPKDFIFLFNKKTKEVKKTKKAMTLSNFWTKKQKSEICKIPTKILVNQP